MARPRKIVPSVPSQPGISSLVPGSIQRLAAGCTDTDLLKLQRDFMDMYSASQQTVGSSARSQAIETLLNLSTDHQFCSLATNSRFDTHEHCQRHFLTIVCRHL